MTKRDPSQIDEADRFEIHDSIGVRTLVVPAGSYYRAYKRIEEDILYIEAITGTRLKNGESADWYFLLWLRYRRAREPNGRVTFADYCSRLYPGRIDVVHEDVAAVDGAASSSSSELATGTVAKSTKAQKAIMLALQQSDVTLNRTGLGELRTVTDVIRDPKTISGRVKEPIEIGWITEPLHGKGLLLTKTGLGYLQAAGGTPR